jgi:hypothetical protein
MNAFKVVLLEKGSRLLRLFIRNNKQAFGVVLLGNG